MMVEHIGQLQWNFVKIYIFGIDFNEKLHLPLHRSLPFTNIPTRSHNAEASSIECDVNSTAVPHDFIA